MRKLIIAVLLSYLSVAGEVKANFIVNGSFELGDYSPIINGSFVVVPSGSTKLTGWTVGGAGIDWHQNSYEIQSAFDGARMADLNRGGGGLADTGTLSQSFVTHIGETYVLRFYLAGPRTGFPDPRQVRVNIAGMEQIFSQPASNNLALVWGEQVLPFTAISTTTTLQFSSVNGSGFWGPFLDNVSVNVIPEPANVVLLGIGIFGILIQTWWRGK